MEIESSSLMREIYAITSSGPKDVHAYWDADILVNSKVLKPLKVLSIDFLTDYENNFSDEIIIKLALSGGMYAKQIYPYNDNVQIKIYRKPLGESGNLRAVSDTLESEIYTATMIDRGNPIYSQNGGNTPTEQNLDLGSIFEIEFQLMNKALEQLRLITVGGIYRNTTVENVVKGILTTESKKIQTDGVREIKGIDMIPAANTTARDHLVIPHGTKLIDIPEYVHKKCGGIYSAGLGYYLQGDYWYIYPCFDTTRFNTEERKLVIINVPQNKFPNVERTFKQDGKKLTIIATGEVKFSDDSEIQQLNAGNGVRFSDAKQFMNEYTKTSNNKTLAQRGRSTNEFVATPRKNEINVTLMSSNHINANPYIEYSKLARRQGAIFSFVWENSSPYLIFPGMVTKVMYLDGSEIKEFYGVVLKEHDYVGTYSPGLTVRRHTCRSMISVFIKHPEE